MFNEKESTDGCLCNLTTLEVWQTCWFSGWFSFANAIGSRPEVNNGVSNVGNVDFDPLINRCTC